jgi:inosine/xanthosine triphosphatase
MIELKESKIPFAPNLWYRKMKSSICQTKMHIFIGSTNPVKINAATGAASEQWPDVVVEGVKVATGVDEQPRSDEETKQGAINRARAVLAEGVKRHPELTATGNNDVLGMGLEGGIVDDGAEMWTTVWAAVVDQGGNLGLSAGSRFIVPEIIAAKIRAGGEMGPVIAEVLGESDVNRIKQSEGVIGVVTEGFVDRTEEYQAVAKLALGVWFGRNWQQNRGL